ncbi:MAG: glycine cleavage system protein H [Robiginitomaculum sp.]|nr:MAG: glycine cleavage system protein H [Robiginitomaculum sp.]
MKYTEDHEWIRLAKDGDSDIATIGISAHAAEQLGDVVFVELPDIDAEFDKGDDVAVVESVKAASEIYAPISGTITAVNGTLEDAPETVNAAPEAGGWFFKMKITDASELDGMMDADAYKKFLED